MLPLYIICNNHYSIVVKNSASNSFYSNIIVVIKVVLLRNDNISINIVKTLVANAIHKTTIRIFVNREV